MNRKEGIIVGIVVLATFITGVFAVPEQQLLNVFVTNQPENETRVVFSETLTVAANTTFNSGFITVDSSQFRQARVFFEVLFTGHTLSMSAVHGGVQTVFPLSVPGISLLGASYSTGGGNVGCSSEGCVSSTMTDNITVDMPQLDIFFGFTAHEDLEVTARVVVFLQT